MKNKKYLLFVFGITWTCKCVNMIDISTVSSEEYKIEITGHNEKLGPAKCFMYEPALFTYLISQIGNKNLLLTACPDIKLNGTVVEVYMPINQQTNVKAKVVGCCNTTVLEVLTKILDLWNKILVNTEGIESLDYQGHEDQLKNLIQQTSNMLQNDNFKVMYQGLISLRGAFKHVELNARYKEPPVLTVRSAPNQQNRRKIVVLKNDLYMK